MAEEKKPRVYRSKEERKAAIDDKIKYHKECIKALEAKKAAIDKGRQGGTRTKTLKRLITDAKLNDAELIKIMSLGDEEQIRAELNKIIESKAKSEGNEG